MSPCAIPGCFHTRRPYGRLCDSHQTAKRRHGDPQQRSVTGHELQPYLKTVRAHIARNAANPAWGQLDAIWSELLALCAERLREDETGRPYVRFDRQARQQLSRLDGLVRPREVVEAVLAMYMLQEFDPRRFRSDEAFRFQLVRRVRSLAEVNVGAYWDHKTKRMKRVYRDLNPRTIRSMGEYLARALGPAGIHVACVERRRGEEQEQSKEALRQALSELQ